MQQCKYKNKCTKANIIVVWGTIDEKVDLKQLILFKNENLDLGQL